MNFIENFVLFTITSSLYFACMKLRIAGCGCLTDDFTCVSNFVYKTVSHSVSKSFHQQHRVKNVSFLQYNARNLTRSIKWKWKMKR